MTRGSNFADINAYRQQVRQPLVDLRVWLPEPESDMTAADMRAALAAIMAACSTVADVPYVASPARRSGLIQRRYRVTAAQRGMIVMLAAIHGATISEAARGIVLASTRGGASCPTE